VLICDVILRAPAVTSSDRHGRESVGKCAVDAILRWLVDAWSDYCNTIRVVRLCTLNICLCLLVNVASSVQRCCACARLTRTHTQFLSSPAVLTVVASLSRRAVHASYSRTRHPAQFQIRGLRRCVVYLQPTGTWSWSWSADVSLFELLMQSFMHLVNGSQRKASWTLVKLVTDRLRVFT